MMSELAGGDWRKFRIEQLSCKGPTVIIEPNCKESDRTISSWLSLEYCCPHVKGMARLCVPQAFISLHLQEKEKKPHPIFIKWQSQAEKGIANKGVERLNVVLGVSPLLHAAFAGRSRHLQMWQC